jgi:hypothetical protein
MMGLPPAGLLAIEEMPRIPALDIPKTFYVVTCEPGVLAGMSYPSKTTPWMELYRIGIRHVVCLTQKPPDYHTEPLIMAGHFPLQDLFGGVVPDNEKTERNRVLEATGKVFSLITLGKGVVVHCEGGTGRTGTVIGCVLKRLGYNAFEILAYLDALNKKRGSHDGWPESQWQADLLYQYPEMPKN